MKKKLKVWQIALLIIFYPVGIVYLIVKFCSKEKKDPAPTLESQAKELTVYITDGGKKYHLFETCGRNKDMKPISEAEAIARGLQKCSICFGGYQEEIARNDNILDILSCSLVACVYPNPDGTSRQTYLATSRPGQDVIFKPAPTKEYPDTIGVFTDQGCIGVLPYTTLNKLRGLYTHNNASAVIEEIQHSERGLGCTIKITIYK